MSTTLAGTAFEHGTQLKRERACLEIAHVETKRLGHKRENNLPPGNVFPLERLHFQAFSFDTDYRHEHPAMKHHVTLADVRHAQYSIAQENRRYGQRLFRRLPDLPESGGKGPEPQLRIDRSPTQESPVFLLRSTTCNDLRIMGRNHLAVHADVAQRIVAGWNLLTDRSPTEFHEGVSQR